jgi:hypothetical protein
MTCSRHAGVCDRRSGWTGDPSQWLSERQSSFDFAQPPETRQHFDVWQLGDDDSAYFGKLPGGLVENKPGKIPAAASDPARLRRPVEEPDAQDAMGADVDSRDAGQARPADQLAVAGGPGGKWNDNTPPGSGKP